MLHRESNRGNQTQDLSCPAARLLCCMHVATIPNLNNCPPLQCSNIIVVYYCIILYSVRVLYICACVVCRKHTLLSPNSAHP